MRFYTIGFDHVDKIHLSTYTSRLVILTWVENVSPFETKYLISDDPKKYVSFDLNILVLYDLTDEDFTYLNLAGVDIKYAYGFEITDLASAIEDKRDSFIYKS